MNALAQPIPAPALDVEAVRRDFAIFQRDFGGRPVAFLDSAASAQKPEAVIEAMAASMRGRYANIHRGVYTLSQESTADYEAARASVAGFLNAAKPEEIVFTRNATEAINLIAASWGMANLKAGDEVVLTELEHHANIVPWQMLRERIGIALRVVPVRDDGSVSLQDVEAALTPQTRLVAVSGLSNVLGTVLPVREITALAHDRGIPVLVDACQLVVHGPVDVQAIGCDFLVFSGHKLYGPTGIGALYAREEMLAAMPPYQGGGDMVEHVSFAETTFQPPPARFEAGTPAIVEAIGLHAAIDYLAALGWDAIQAHEAALAARMQQALAGVPGLRPIGTAPGKAGVFSFVLEGCHPHDIGTILDKKAVAVRSGHHCAFPLMERFGVTGTTRASLGIYNTAEDIDRLVEGLELARELLQ